jgi:hypothetical protein
VELVFIIAQTVEGKLTMTPAIIEEDLWYFCGFLRNADDIAISTTRTPALQGTLVLHGNDCEREGLRVGKGSRVFEGVDEAEEVSRGQRGCRIP